MKLKGVNAAINPDVVPMGVPMSPVQDGEEEKEFDAPAASVVVPPEEQEKADRKKSRLVMCCAALVGFAVGLYILVKLTFVWLSFTSDSVDKDAIEES